MSINVLYFFFNDTATTEIYTLSLHDALPIYVGAGVQQRSGRVLVEIEVEPTQGVAVVRQVVGVEQQRRSEEHTSELQSRQYLVCRLLLEKKKRLLYIISTLVMYTADSSAARK